MRLPIYLQTSNDLIITECLHHDRRKQAQHVINLVSDEKLWQHMYDQRLGTCLPLKGIPSETMTSIGLKNESTTILHTIKTNARRT